MKEQALEQEKQATHAVTLLSSSTSSGSKFIALTDKNSPKYKKMVDQIETKASK